MRRYMTNYMLKWLFSVFTMFSFCVSCTEILETDIRDEVVQIIAPSDSCILSDTVLWFSWEAMEGADHYVFQVATPSFTQAERMVVDSVLSQNNLELPMTRGAFEWRIKGVNSAYESAYATLSFVLK